MYSAFVTFYAMLELSAFASNIGRLGDKKNVSVRHTDIFKYVDFYEYLIIEQHPDFLLHR